MEKRGVAIRAQPPWRALPPPAVRSGFGAQTATQAPLPGRARLVVDCDCLQGTGTQFRCMTIPGVASSWRISFAVAGSMLGWAKCCGQVVA